MIEVEKKFIPTVENLEILLKDVEFLGEVVNHDIAYDYPDLRFLKAGNIVLRNRNGNFELKIRQAQGINIEIEDRKEIEKYFNTFNLEEFINKNLIIAIEYKTIRKKYKKDGFIIDIDEMEFGYKVGEIELMVDKEEDVKNAEEKIYQFALSNKLELKSNFSKKREYLKKFKPDLYKEIYEKN